MKLSLLLTIALLSLLTACSSPEPHTIISTPSRIDLQCTPTPGTTLELWIATDTQTGCQFLVTKDGYSGGVTWMPNTCGGGKK